LRRCVFEYAYRDMEVGDGEIIPSEFYEEENGVDEEGFRLYTLTIV
jgi:hypothetical protein